MYTHTYLGVLRVLVVKILRGQVGTSSGRSRVGAASFRRQLCNECLELLCALGHVAGGVIIHERRQMRW